MNRLVILVGGTPNTRMARVPMRKPKATAAAPLVHPGPSPAGSSTGGTGAWFATEPKGIA